MPLSAQALLQLPNIAAKKERLQASLDDLKQNPTLARQITQTVRDEANRALRGGKLKDAYEIVELLQDMAIWLADDQYRALALRIKGNLLAIGQGQNQAALACYDEACQIYRQTQNIVQAAATQTARIWCLANLDKPEEAVAEGEKAAAILEEAEEWVSLIGVLGNVATIYERLGKDQRALRLLNKIKTLCQTKPVATQAFADNLPAIELNRSIHLRHLGHFSEAIQAAMSAHDAFYELGHEKEMARAQLSLSNIYFLTGQYNKALATLEQVLDIYRSDDRWADIARVELKITTYLLQLRQFTAVLNRTQQLVQNYETRQMKLELGITKQNEALAHMGQKQFGDALTALQVAHHLFETLGNQVMMTKVELETAVVHYYNGHFQRSLTHATRCLTFFEQQERPLEAGQARLVIARNTLALTNDAQTEVQLTQILSLCQHKNLPWLCYQAQLLRGQLAESQSDLLAAQQAYAQAVSLLETLQSRLMSEYRPDFLVDKESAYNKSVYLALQQNQIERAIAYVGRAKSRVLLDLITQRVNLRIQPQNEADQSLIDTLQQTRNERDQLVRRQQAQLNERPYQQQQIAEFEGQITENWHKLLIRNAAYGRDADLWQPQTTNLATLQNQLDESTLLLEYFVSTEAVYLFVVSHNQLKAYPLPTTASHLFNANKRLEGRRKLLPHLPQEKRDAHALSFQKLLQQWYEQLLAPIADILTKVQNLVVVPHSHLHYVPFHALYNGRSYLLETHEVRYLPNTNLLPFYRQTRHTNTACLSLGYSNNGQLPHTQAEAQTVAHILNGEHLLEEAATLQTLRAKAPYCRVIHLATHGIFRSDNPLFSGLQLADNDLTTLDIFSLPLSASLVTLSACQTGQHVISGGDELLGLTRAFLYAGAASLVLSLWPVADDATTHFMALFYQKLADGYGKGAALRQAQRHFIFGTADVPATYAHPYYWSPFFLVGDSGKL